MKTRLENHRVVVCTGSGGVDMATWALFSAAVDRSADIPASGRGSPVVACDAVSLGFRGDLAPVTLRNDAARPITRCR